MSGSACSETAFGFFQAVDVPNVGMVQACQDFGFTLKPCQSLRVSRERFGEDLQRDLAIQLRIGGLIDLSHAALADEGGHVVVGDAGTDFQSYSGL